MNGQSVGVNWFAAFGQMRGRVRYFMSRYALFPRIIFHIAWRLPTFCYVHFLAVSPAANIKNLANRRSAISVRNRIRAAAVTAVAIPTFTSQRIIIHVADPGASLAKGLSINRRDLMQEMCSLLLYIQLARISQILRLSLSLSLLVTMRGLEVVMQHFAEIT